MKRRLGKFNWGVFLTFSMFILIFGTVFLSLINGLFHSLSSTTSIVLFIVLLISGFLLIGSVQAIKICFPKWNYIELSEEGFQYKLSFIDIFFRWEDCGKFKVSRSWILSNKITFIIENPDPQQKFMPQKVGYKFTFYNCYGYKAKKLALLLNEYQNQSLDARSGA